MKIEHKKLFGSGLRIAFFGILFALIALWIHFFFPDISSLEIPFHTEISAGFFVLWLVMFVYSFVALPNKQKGNKLVTNGLYTYIRHPLYASFLIILYFALFLYSQSLWVLIAQIMSIIMAGKIVAHEEVFMVELFGEEYKEYAKRTKKFVPFLF